MGLAPVSWVCQKLPGALRQSGKIREDPISGIGGSMIGLNTGLIIGLNTGMNIGLTTKLITGGIIDGRFQRSGNGTQKRKNI
jgi:hypothetical protein